MKLASVIAGTAIIAAASMQGASAWWDAGHLVSAQIAVNYLNGETSSVPTTVSTTPDVPSAPEATTTPSTSGSTRRRLATTSLGDRELQSSSIVQNLNGLLSEWDRDFAGTGTLTTSAIWPDLIKCSTVAPFCPAESTPSVLLFTNWHFVNIPVSLDGYDISKLPANVQKPLDEINQSARVINDILSSFSISKNRWAWNLQLRMLLHVFSDIHNPCHAVAAYNSNMPAGDQGCNLWKFSNCTTVPPSIGHLHALFDSAGNTLAYNWAPPGKGLEQVIATVSADAAKVKSTFPVQDSLEFAALESASNYTEFLTIVKTKGTINKIVEESAELARTQVYPGLDLASYNSTSKLISCPDKAYVEKAATISQKQIAVAGYRLSILLKQIGAQYARVFGSSS